MDLTRAAAPAPAAGVASKPAAQPAAPAAAVSPFTAAPSPAPPAAPAPTEDVDMDAVEGAKHVTIWNTIELRKVAGNAAPLRRNLARFLAAHPECQEYTGQDKDPALAGALDKHVPIWHKTYQRKVTGNAAPLRKNLAAYLRKHTHCEVYDGQDKRGPATIVVHAAPPPGATHLRAPAPAAGTGSVFDRPGAPPTAADGHAFYEGLPQSQHRCKDRPTRQTADMSYKEIVSSWSNLPAWGAGKPGPPGGPNAIPIPGQGGQQTGRADVAMGSLGTSFGNADLARLLETPDAAATPVADPMEAMDFSPSCFLK